MRYKRRVTTVTVGTAAALLAACSGSSTSPASSSASDSVQAAEDVSEVTANEVGISIVSMEGTDSAAAGDVAPSAPVQARRAPTLRVMAALPPDPGCTPQTDVGVAVSADDRDTLAYDLAWQYVAATGCQSAFTASTTDSIYITLVDSAALNGRAQRWHGHHYTSRVHWLTSTNAAGDDSVFAAATAHVWNGNGAAQDTSAFENSAGTVSRSHVWTAADTVTNVTFPHPRDGSYPTGGTWTRWAEDTATFSGSTSGSATYAWHIVLTFNGTEDATLQVYNASSGTLVKTCQVDLLLLQIVPGSCS
jgi:hypothetical protein